MKIFKRSILTLSMLSVLSLAVAQGTKKAPNFTAVDQNGTTHSLSSMQGKIVVIEFTNPGSPVSGKGGCPFMIPRYEQKIMQNLAEKTRQAGGIYLAVNSGHYNTPADSRAIAQQYGVTHPTLQDPTGKIGKAFEAKTTPHMFVIDKSGNIIYDGALNDNPTPDVSKDASATNYVELALAAAQNGTTPETRKTKPYGCGIHYKE